VIPVLMTAMGNGKPQPANGSPVTRNVGLLSPLAQHFPLAALLRAEQVVDEVYVLDGACRGRFRRRVFAWAHCLFHREDLVVLFSGVDQPMDSKQAVVNTLLLRGMPIITIGTDTTREAGLPFNCRKSAGPEPWCWPFCPSWCALTSPNACNSTPTPRGP
jgi:hypothetical protein